MQYPENEVTDFTLQQVIKVIRKVQWQPLAPKNHHPSVLELFNFNKSRKKSHMSSDSDTESLCEEVNYGTKKFWTSLRICLPPRRTNIVWAPP